LRVTSFSILWHIWPPLIKFAEKCKQQGTLSIHGINYA
jgi:hypothetical protein